MNNTGMSIIYIVSAKDKVAACTRSRHFYLWRALQAIFFILDSNKKRKYVPETNDFDDGLTQCPDDNDIFVSEMCSQPLDYQHEDKTTFKDSSTCKENETNSLSTGPSVIDIHGCKYFGQLVSNELLRFDTKKRYKVMQKILEIMHNEK